MNEFDENIKVINENICKNISTMSNEQRGLASQNILNNLRNIIEAIAQRIYSEIDTIELNNYRDIQKAIKYVESRGNLKFLSRFHDFLQASVSHYTPDEDSAVRLMLKYYEWMLRVRDYCKKAFNLSIFENLEDYPLNQDTSLNEYYAKIACKIKNARYTDSNPQQRYYVLKNKPFFIQGEIFYELVVVEADDFTSKFNRFIVFSKEEIPSYYAVKLNFINTDIRIINRNMPIKIVNNYKVAIRPVELEDIANIVGVNKVGTNTIEYYKMMDYLTLTGGNFTEIIKLDDKYYKELKTEFLKGCSSCNFFILLDKCRTFWVEKKEGYNILCYLLLKLRHGIMKNQISSKPNNWLSYLRLLNQCKPFEEMPYDASLHQHNPSLYDLFSSIDVEGHKEELLSRRVRINTEQNVRLFTSVDSIKRYGNVNELIEKFNSRLIEKHKPVRSLKLYGDQIYISGYEADTVWIIRNLTDRIGSGLQGYKNAMISWIAANASVDCEEKKKILPEVFDKTNVSMIYGAAGTGKTTMVKYLAEFFSDESKLFLANTNPAKEHLRRVIKTKRSEFSTIASSKNLVQDNSYDVVFVDECSTVDNFAMRELLKELKCKLIVLVGDVYQIQSVKFGNWFGLARYFLPKETFYELKTPFRSQSDNLIGLWNRVRVLDPKIEEYIYRNKYSTVLNESVFSHDVSDEIILCLNYDGLYGINNINNFLQSDNPNPAVVWDSWTYKVGDPIIFNENNRFYPVLYNNLKGWIRGIEKDVATITFTIEIDMAVNEFGALGSGFELLECNVPGHSLIRFSVNHYIDDDTGEKSNEQVVPFQVAYAISIHKAQGLEYDSVKIIITKEIEELITHNIFYTAITRAKRKLKIYWTPETQNKILSVIEPISNSRDASIISTKQNLII